MKFLLNYNQQEFSEDFEFEEDEQTKNQRDRESAERKFKHNKMMADIQIQEILATLMSVSTKNSLSGRSSVEELPPLDDIASLNDSQFQSEADD